MTLRTISYGGGVQSSALVVLATQGKLDDIVGGLIDAALFANVGDDSEHPASLSYVRDVMTPWAAERGVTVHELRRPGPSIWSHIVDHTGEGLRESIPVRGVNGNPMSRSCTVDWKVNVVGRWLKDHGASKDDPATVCIGISTDELERAGRGTDHKYERRVYPLLNLGLDRSACQQIIADAGLPVPRPSSCFFCPFHRPHAWSEMARDEPDLFDKSVELERVLNERRDKRNKDRVYLTRFGKPLDAAIQPAQDQLPGFESIGESGCDEGYCWT